jgi:1-acyl-sn-glycerol-3-phosphate acyltransferase
MSHLVYYGSSWITRNLILPFYASYEVRGAENMPKSGPVLVVSNHLNDADPGILTWGLPRRVVFMTKSELFDIPILKQFLVSFGTFPVHRGAADVGALRAASAVLKNGDPLVIFPEGTASGPRGGMLLKGHPGAGLIALRSGAPILPCAITGSEHMGMPGMYLKPFRRWKIVFTIGEPFTLPKPARISSESAAEGTRVIMEKIASMLPERYRGYYGSSRQAADESAPPLAGDL